MCEARKGDPFGRKETVNGGRWRPAGDLAWSWSWTVNGEMGVVIYLVLTVAIFALLGLVQKLVERL